MTRARQDQVSLADTPYYHCISRCVRRAYLCGEDEFAGKNYDHRKDWIRDRMKELTDVFAIEVCAYAILSNHYHIVLYVDVDKARAWDGDEVFRRWYKLFGPKGGRSHPAGKNKPVDRLVTEEDIRTWRERLADISWFMRCLNEKIARMANQEDGCKGRFWEGRFKSQALMDEGALLTCMTYVDLNPIRAKISDTPEDSDYTAIQERIIQYWKKQRIQKRKVNSYQNNTTHAPGYGLMPFAKAVSRKSKQKEPTRDYLPIHAQDYFELLDGTGRAIREGKRGKIPEYLNPILERLNLEPKNWLDSVTQFKHHFFNLVGPISIFQAMKDRFEDDETTERQWLKGVGGAKQMYKKVA